MLDSIHITCPFCGERFEALVDTSSGDAEYTEDCPVCCRPIAMHLRTGQGGDFDGLDVDRDE
jgi:hypothetical protein